MSHCEKRILALVFVLALPALFLSPATCSGQADPLVEKARIQIAQKHYKEAVQCLVPALQADPKNAEIANMLGLAYLQLRDPGAAVSYLKRASKLAPQDPRPYNNIGAALHLRKDYKGAIKYYKKAIEMDPKYLLAMYNLGNAYFARKMFLQGIDTMHKIVQIDPEYLMKEELAMEIGVSDLDRAEQLFFIAKLYIQAGDKDKAIHFLKMSIDKGFKDIKKIAKDKDFDPLREDPRFQALTGAAPATPAP